MSQPIATLTLVVADEHDAIAFYRDKVGFALFADQELGGGKRWVLIGPADRQGARLLLARADGTQEKSVIGNQTAGRVMLFLETDDFARDHAAMLARGVEFTEEPRREPYGTVAVLKDLYGNLWDLIEPRS